MSTNLFKITYLVVLPFDTHVTKRDDYAIGYKLEDIIKEYKDRYPERSIVKITFIKSNVFIAK